MKARFIIVAWLMAIGFAISAQVAPDSIKRKSSIWDKKLYWGGTFNTSWVTVKGNNLPDEYFKRPTTAYSLRMEYFFHKNVGLSLGVQYQQKGAGIITPDFVKDLGDPDSTYRARIKLKGLEIPILIILRSGEVIKNTRFQGSLGIAPLINMQSKFVQYSVEDGFHVIEIQNDRYYKSDFAFTASGGLNINAGNACIFQIHLYGTWGTKNVFNADFYPNASGKTKVFGLKLGWMF